MNNKNQNNDFICDFCGIEQNTLYIGWFRTEQALNPFAKGTASAGLIQQRQACLQCADEAIKNGIACATSVPSS